MRLSSGRSSATGFRIAELTLPTAELIGETQTDGARTTHRYGFVPLGVVRIELGARVGEILSVELHAPPALSETERRIIRGECGQIISRGVALQVMRQIKCRRERE